MVYFWIDTYIDLGTDITLATNSYGEDNRQRYYPLQTVSNSYTYENYRLKTISHNGFNYSFNYDDFGNVTQTKVGSQVLSTNTYGNNNGDLKRVEYENGNYVDYTYDDYGNISAISQDGDTNFKWQYDSTGNMYAHDDLVNNQRFVYTYDSTGRLVRQQVLDSGKKNLYSSQYGYDLNNNVSRLTSSAGGVSVTENFEYGKDNLASKYTYPSGKTATYTYDGILRRNKTVINTTTPIEQTYRYMASARGNGAQTTKIDEEKLGGNLYKYTYDANGNITCIMCKKNTDTDFVKQQQFAYDELNQLIRADDLAKNCTEVYNYDNGGNILSTKVYSLTWGSLSGVTATKTTNYTYGDSNWKDKLTAFNGREITYDAIGNPLSYRGYTLTWQNGRQLASMQLMQMRIEFTYDVDGLRTSKTIPNVDLEHKYYYVGDRLQYEMIGDSSALWYFYDADGNPSGIRYKDNSGTVNDYYFVCNWRGDVIQIYNAAGELVATYDYDAWGNVTEKATSADTQGITETNPIRYRGYYYDSETGLYYVNSRYYDPVVKRFLNSDDDLLSATSPETLTDKNYFTYCDNNPVGRADDEGNFWHIVIGAAVSGVLSATTQVIEQGGIHSQKDVAKAAVCLVTGAISGGVGATGIGVFASAGIDAGLTMVTSLGIDLIDNDFELGNVDWREIAVDTIDAGVTGLVFGKAYDNAIDDVVKKSQKAITKGKNKIIKGITSKKTASKVKGTIKTGQKLIRANRKRINKIKAWGSVLGSIVSTARSIVNKFRRR